MTPMFTRSPRTISMTPVLLATVSSTTVGASRQASSAARSSISQCGTRCSAVVWLAAMASRCEIPERIDRIARRQPVRRVEDVLGPAKDEPPLLGQLRACAPG